MLLVASDLSSVYPGRLSQVLWVNTGLHISPIRENHEFWMSLLIWVGFEQWEFLRSESHEIADVSGLPFLDPPP